DEIFLLTDIGVVDVVVEFQAHAASNDEAGISDLNTPRLVFQGPSLCRRGFFSGHGCVQGFLCKNQGSRQVNKNEQQALSYEFAQQSRKGHASGAMRCWTLIGPRRNGAITSAGR